MIKIGKTICQPAVNKDTSWEPRIPNEMTPMLT
jgi:hypothetical protein